MLLSALPAGAAQYAKDDDTVVYVDFDSELPSGSVNNGVTFADGIYGKAGVFNGTSYIKLPNDITKDVTDFTMAAWVKFDATTSWQRVLDFGNGQNNFAFLGLATGSNVRGSMQNGGKGEEKLSSANNSVKSGEWVHMAMVQEGNQRTLYLNGENVHSLTVSHNMAAMGSTNQNYIGKSQFSGDPGLKGTVDEVVFAKKAMSAEEVAKLAEVSESILKTYVDLGDTSAVEKDLVLPTEANGATVTWETSDPSVITKNGEITRALEDKTATLTATITLGDVTATKDFEVKVLRTNAFDIDFENADSIKENVSLPEAIDDAKIEWSSSDEAVISSKPVQNGEYVIPAGKVTRGDEDQKVALTAKITLGDYSETKTFDLTVKAKPQPLGEMGGYLYAYFRGAVNGSEEHLQIHIAASEDGYKWFDLNGNWPILTSTMGTTGLRDPYLIRSKDGDRFYLIATDLNTLDGQGWGPWSLNGSKYLAVWESDDLVNWSEQRMVKFANDDIGCAWAPEAIWDPETEEYLVYAAGKDLKLLRETGQQVDTVYVVRTRDFRTFSEPEYFVAPTDANGKRIMAIDSTIIRADDGKYYQFYKKYNSEIHMMVSDHASGPYEEVSAFTPIGGEGPAIYKVNGSDKYCLCVDNYSVYVPYLTDNIASGIFTKANADVVMPTGSKHGGMLPVTVEEYDRLLEKWGPKGPEAAEGTPAAFEWDFEEESAGKLFGNAQVVYDEERGSNVLKLDGTDGTYFEFPENIFDQKDTFTLSFDVKSNSTDTKNHMTFAMGPDSDKYYFFKVNPTSVRAAITNASWQKEEAAAADVKENQAGQWMHIDLVVTPDRLAVYKDKVLIAEQTNVSKTITHLGLEGVKAYLGKSVYNGDPYFNGEFDNVALYYRALSDGEIAHSVHIMNAKIEGSKVSCDVAAESEKKGIIIVASYDTQGCVTEAKAEEFTAAAGTTHFETTVSEGADKVKIMFWESQKTMTPYAECKKIEK